AACLEGGLSAAWHAGSFAPVEQTATARPLRQPAVWQGGVDPAQFGGLEIAYAAGQIDEAVALAATDQFAGQRVELADVIGPCPRLRAVRMGIGDSLFEAAPGAVAQPDFERPAKSALGGIGF